VGDDRFGELKAKAASEGLTSDEADELGRLYAENARKPYTDAESGSDADAVSQDQESQERRKLEAADQAEATQERDRSQGFAPGEPGEPK
jgi:hypothetical protein